MLAMLAVPIRLHQLWSQSLECFALLRDQMHSLHEIVTNAEADALMSSEQLKCDGKSCVLQLMCIRLLHLLHCAGCAFEFADATIRTEIYIAMCYCTCNVIFLVSTVPEGIGLSKDKYVGKTTKRLLGWGLCNLISHR